MNQPQKLYLETNDVEQLSNADINDKKYDDLRLLCNLSFMRIVNGSDELELDPNSDSAKLELEMAKYGLKVTPDTDVKQLAATLKLLGLV